MSAKQINTLYRSYTYYHNQSTHQLMYFAQLRYSNVTQSRNNTHKLTFPIRTIYDNNNTCRVSVWRNWRRLMRFRASITAALVETTRRPPLHCGCWLADCLAAPVALIIA